MQRSDYGFLIAELAKRFTPVRLPAIQMQVFHDRRQGPAETVDEFAQELRQLYAKAYAPVTRGTPEAEEVGQHVLTSQFVTRLRVDIQSAVVGLEGDMDHLLMKAHFEETKRRELAAVRTTCSIQKVSQSSPIVLANSAWKSPSPFWKTDPPDTTVPKMNGSTRRCYNCGVSGHTAHACPYPKPSQRDGEATGRPVLVVSVDERMNERGQHIEELRQELREAELADDVDKATPAAHNVSPTPESKECTLEPLMIVQMGVNGVLTDALVDTGSPATIVSLKFILQVLGDSKDRQQTSEEWRKKTIERFSAPAVALTSCGGERLNIVAQIPVVLSQGERNLDAVVLVQKDAPHSLLLGTDLQAQLGFSLFSETNGRRVDLLLVDINRPDHMDQVEVQSPLSEQPFLLQLRL